MDCTKLSSITLPQTVKTIGNGAFVDCDSLESISLPNGLESLGELAFGGCNSLLSITLPNNITTIENNTFDGCTSLESATINGVVRTIGLNAFQNCSSLDNLYIRIDDDFSIGNNAFLGCNELSQLRVKVSKATSFSTLLNSIDCSKITKVSMDALSSNSFESECIMLIGSVLTNVEEVYFGYTINSIPADAFLNHKHLKEVYLYFSDYSASIGDYAFDGCANLTYFQGGVYSLGDFCFRNTKITSLQLSAKKGEYWDDEDYDWYYGDCFYKELNHVGLNPFFGVDNFTFKKTYGNYELIYDNYIVNSSSIYDKSGKCCVATSSSSVSVSGTLADYAISGSSVKNLNLTNVTTVGDGFLVYCPLLEKITVNSDNTAFTTVEDVLYTKDMTELVKYPIAKNAVEMTIPASVTKIWDHAFQVSGYGTESLRIINVEATVPPTISYYTTDLYNSEIYVRVPYGCKAAYEAVEGWRAFKGIVEMPEPMVNITFADANVKALCVANWDTNGDGELSEAEAAAVTSLGEVFKGNTEITSFDELQYFTGLTTIGSEAFRGCSSLNSIDLSGMTVTIAEEAFLGTGLEEVTIPATVTLTGWTNFGWCNSLKTVTVECEGELPNDIFKACAQLETAVLPSASAMKWGSFIDCPKLKSITFTSGDAGDVPYFRNFAGTPDDVLFNVPSGTAESFLMKGYWNLSDMSALPTVKAQFEAEAVAIETMVNGINDGDKTTLANAISEARAAVTNADSYASVLEQLAAIKAAAKIFIAGATLTENTDITAATITNAYFNNFTIGWKHGWAQSGTYSTENIINGDVAMDKFIEAWDPSEGNLYSQTIKSLPAGIYRLEADIVTNPLDAAEVEGVSLFAGKSQTDVVTGTNQPQHFSLQFNNNIVGDCAVGIRIAATHSVNYVAMDNVRLYYVGEVADVPQGIDLVSDADARVYLYNVETGKYLNAGHAYGAHAILDETGLPVRLTKDSETGLWQIYFWEGSKDQQLLFDEGEDTWVDYNGQSDYSPWWSITQTGDGNYLIQGTAKAGTENYLGNNPSRQDLQKGYNAVSYTDIISTATSSANIHWRIFSKDDADRTAAKNRLIATILRVEVSGNANDDLLASAMSVYTDANATLAAIIDATTLLNSQMGMPTEGNSIDMTVLITNPRFENNTTEGWTGANAAGATNCQEQEFFQSNFNMYQTITGVPNGRYLLKWKGFHRPGAKETVAADYAAGTDNASAVVYANDVQKTMLNIASDMSNAKLCDTDYESADGFFPDRMDGARLYFDANHYADQLEVEVTDNVLTIGVKNTENMGDRHWVIFSDFELYILENAEQMHNKITISDISSVPGGSATLSVNMNNETQIASFSVDLHLPTGVTPKTDTNGNIVVKAGTRVPMNVLGNVLTDGTCRFVAMPNGQTISAGEGMVFSFVIKSSDEMEVGNYEISTNNIRLVKNDLLRIRPFGTTSKLTLNEIALGDVNGDGEVDITDATIIVYYVLGRTSNLNLTVADINGDGEVDITDATIIVYRSLGRYTSTAPARSMDMVEPQ